MSNTTEQIDLSPKTGTPVRHICLPAEVSDNVYPPELAEKYVDGLLDPVRLPRGILQNKLAELGPFGYAGQYEQRPVPLSGGLFHADKVRIDLAPPAKFEAILRFWDKAACLFLGTLITTARGQVPIEEVTTTDYVLTRQGYRRVLWSGVSGYVDALTRVTFTNGCKLVGTEDHPVWSVYRGWVHLAKLLVGEPVLSRNGVCHVGKVQKDIPIPKSKCSMGSRTVDGLVRGTTKQWCETESLVNTTVSHTIEHCGKNIMEKSRRDIMFTTRMETSTIINLVTLNVCPPKSIENSNRSHELLDLGDYPCGNTISITSINATIVENLSRVGISDLSPIQRLLGTAVRSVVRFTEKKITVPVYDVTVDGVPEFYANDILVHNSADGDGAYTAGVKMARTIKGTCVCDFWVLDVVRGRWDAFTREKIIRQVAEFDGKGVRIGMEQEPGSGGKESALNTIRNLAGFRVYAERATGSKIDRATPYASMVNGGFVGCVNAAWTAAYIEEMRNFGDLAKYKDQIDASSGAFNFLANRKKPAGGGGF